MMASNTPSEIPKFDYKSRDNSHWQRLESIIHGQGFTLRDVLRYFPAYIRRRELPRFLAHYELFKQIVDLPGSIVELGVYRGASFFTWANLLETFCPGDRYRMVYGFDHFEGLTQYTNGDGALDENRGKFVGAYSSSAEAMRELVEIHNDDNLVPGIARCRLIEGDVLETLPRFVNENPGLRISLVHLDMDLYDPTRLALELLYPHVVEGGIVVADEYGWPEWAGESQAVDEFLSSLPKKPSIKRFPTTGTPGGYFVK
jgi:hypothetical protein